MKIALAGAGAFGIKHLDGLKKIAQDQPDVEVVALIGRRREQTQEVADTYGIPHVFTQLEDALKLPLGSGRNVADLVRRPWTRRAYFL